MGGGGVKRGPHQDGFVKNKIPPAPEILFLQLFFLLSFFLVISKYLFVQCNVIFSMCRPWGSHSHLLPMASSLYCLYVCSVVVAFICIKKRKNMKGP